MQNSQPDDSYKLHGAAQIAARLFEPGAKGVQGAAAAPAPPGYIRFRGPDARPAPSAPGASSPVPQPAEAAIGWEPEMAGASGWHVLLTRVEQAVNAVGAFVVDPQGLVIASVGNTPGDGPEAVGSRLAFAFEQADRMGDHGTRCQTITIELGEAWLSGLRITVCDEVRLVVGICGHQPLPPEVLHALARVFVRKAMGA